MKRTELKHSTKPIAKKRGTSAAAAKRKADEAWRIYIRTRDQVCQVCGRDNGALHAHHVMIRNFSATRTDEGNGLLACYQCHQDKLHGDPAFAVGFYTTRFGLDGYAALRQKAYDGVGSKFPASFWQSERTRLSGLLETHK